MSGSATSGGGASGSGTSRAAERAEIRRESILDASERMFAEKGYHATGIADIANELGIGHGTFYRYFKNKHDIALQIFDRLIERFAEIALAEDPTASQSIAEYRAQTDRILTRWLALGESHPHVLRFFHEQSLSVDVDRMARVIEAYVIQTMRFLQNGVDKGFLRRELDVEATAQMLVALIFEGTRRTLAMRDVEARRGWVEAGMALMFDGVRAR